MDDASHQYHIDISYQNRNERVNFIYEYNPLRKPKDKKSIGKIIILCVLGGFVIIALLSTFIIATSHDIEWEYNWLVTIMINIFVDLLISPWIQVIFTLAIYYISVVKVYKPVEGLKVPS